jgi:hypothetical protein
MYGVGFDKSGGVQVIGPKTFYGPISLNPVVLTSTASITLDASLGNVFYLPLAVSGATTFNAPSGPTDGQQISLIIKHVSGSNAATWNSAWYFPGGVDATLSTISGSIDLIGAVYSATIGAWLTTFAKGFA